MKNKYLVPALRAGAVVILTAAAMIAPLENLPFYVRLIAFLIPYLIAGYDVIKEALEGIVHGEVFDECFLMTLATVGAFAIGEYPEAVAVMFFFQVGEFLEDLSVDRARDSITGLMDLRAEHADVLRDGRIIRVLPEEVLPGEVVVVRPGDRFPLDGVISRGSTSVDTSALTGESAPRDAGEGDAVCSGTVNLTGAVEVTVTGTYEQSTVAKILELVEQSSEKKSRAENFISRFAKIYTPAVVLSALALFLVPSIVTGEWSAWLHRALVFLVVSCPCALVVSVPLAFFAGIGGASRSGVLIKGANYLEALSKARTVVFDKTGTLTRGRFAVTAVHPEKMSEDELLDVAAAAESMSNHPIAESVIAAHGGHIDPARLSGVKERPGEGVEAVLDGRSVLVGNSRLMDAEGITWTDCGHVETVIHVAREGEYLGHIVVADEIKEGAAQAISDLHGAGVGATVMLTGDREAVGVDVAQKLGVDEAFCELLPGGKVEKLEELIAAKPAGGSVVFVGDGINDAPALTRADVGCAMGALGSDAAIEAADVVLMDDDPRKLAPAVRRAKKTMGIVRANIVFALAVKAAVLALGAAGLSNMWAAVFADVGVTLLCVLNSVRAMRPDKK